MRPSAPILHALSLTLVLVLGLSPGAAPADTRLTITLEDRDPFGTGTPWCRPAFETSGGSAVGAAVIEGIVSLAGADGPADLCWFRHRDGQREGPYCSGEDDAALACADVARLTLQRLSCSDESGAERGCGAVTLERAGAGSVAPAMAPGATERAALEIVLAPLFDKDLFGDPWGCHVDAEARFSPRDDDRRVTLAYAIDAGGRDGGTCEVTLGSHASSGSCGGGVKDYTCADITGIEITSMRCSDAAGAAADCGTVRTTILGHDGR